MKSRFKRRQQRENPSREQIQRKLDRAGAALTRMGLELNAKERQIVRVATTRRRGNL